MELILEYPIWFLIPAALVAAGFGVMMYLRSRPTDHFDPTMKRLLAVIRSLAAFLIIVLLLGPLIKTLTQEVEKPVILVGIDNSSSINLGKDSTFYNGEYKEQLAQFQQKLGADHQVRSFSFGSQVSQRKDPDFTDSRTDLSELLREFDDQFVGKNVGATVIMSDGIVNRGSDPTYHNKRFSGPIHTVALGDTTTQRDLKLDRIDANKYAFLGNRFPIEVLVAANKLKGKSTTLVIKADGKELFRQKIDITSEDFNKKVKTDLLAETAGMTRLSVSVTQLEGEISTFNNRKDIFIEVLDGRQKILILAGAPHPDVAAIRSAVSTNNNYEVKVAIAGVDKLDLPAYDLVILHQVPFAKRASSGIFEELSSQNIPTWFIIGMNSELSGLKRFLPGVNITPQGRTSNEMSPLLARNFPLFQLKDGTSTLVSKLPPVTGYFGTYNISEGAVTLMNQKIGSVETQNPLWVFLENQGVKSSVTFGEGLWRWKMADHVENNSHDLFNSLITKTVQYLAVKTDKSLFQVSGPKTLAQEDVAVFSAELYNESYELVNEPEVSLTVTNAEGAEFPFTFSRTESAYRINAGSFAEGDYTYLARTTFNGKTFEKSGQFQVAALRMESNRTRADHGLMYRLANGNGGNMFFGNELDKLADTILSGDGLVNVIYERTWFKEVIHQRWMCLLIILLLAAEWFTRKRNGAY